LKLINIVNVMIQGLEVKKRKKKKKTVTKSNRKIPHCRNSSKIQ
jgi:hypothetical protein